MKSTVYEKNVLDRKEHERHVAGSALTHKQEKNRASWKRKRECKTSPEVRKLALWMNFTLRLYLSLNDERKSTIRKFGFLIQPK